MRGGDEDGKRNTSVNPCGHLPYIRRPAQAQTQALNVPYRVYDYQTNLEEQRTNPNKVVFEVNKQVSVNI